MAKQIEGVYEAVLDCAKKECLEKGYKDASLRTHWFHLHPLWG